MKYEKIKTAFIEAGKACQSTAAADAGDASDAEYGVARVSGETADVSGGAIEGDGGTAKLE